MDESKKSIVHDVSKPALSPQFVEFFLLDADICVSKMEKYIKKDGEHTEEDVKSFTIAAHSMKNALAQIGEQELSKVAEKLEKAGWDNNLDNIKDAPDFINKLKAVIERLTPEDDGNTITVTDVDFIDLKKKMFIIKQAVDNYDNKTAKDTINEQRKKGWPGRLKKLLGEMSEQLLSGNPKEVICIADLISDICENR